MMMSGAHHEHAGGVVEKGEKYAELLNAFKVVCQSDDRTAHYYLLAHDWSLQRATDQYYDDGCPCKNAKDLNELIKKREVPQVEKEKRHESSVSFKPSVFGSHLRATIAHLFESKELSDLTIVLPTSRIKAHRTVLASSSSKLSALLNSSNGGKELNLDEEDEEVFNIILKYIYTGEAHLTAQQVPAVLHSAHKYELGNLKEKCGVFLYEQHFAKGDRAKNEHEEQDKGKEKEKDTEQTQTESVQKGDINYLLATAQTYGCHELERLCAEHLARNFGTLVDESKLNTLPRSTFIELIKSDKVAALEEEILSAVLEYAQYHAERGEDKTELLSELLLYVRFAFIQSQRLIDDVERNPVIADLKITKDLLYETYRYNFYRRFYNQHQLMTTDKQQKGKERLGEDDEDSMLVDRSESVSRTAPTLVFSSPIPHFELRCTPRNGALKWSPTKKSRDMWLSNNLLTATHRGPSSVWVSVVADVPFSDHLSSAYVRIDHNSSNWLFVGVVEQHWNDYADSGNYVGLNRSSWSHGSASGYALTHNGSNSAGYGSAYSTGDVMGVHLDVAQGILSFSKNGQDLGPAFTSLPRDTPLYLAVTLYRTGDQVTLSLRGEKGRASQATPAPSEEAESPNEEWDPGFSLFE